MTTHGAPTRCLNCGALLLGRFCASCGQGADVHVPGTLELVHEVLEGVTHSDSRLWRTLLYLWFKPGKLTLEFIAGRRAAYLPPFRLYLVLSVIFFLAASFAHPKVYTAELHAGKIQVRSPELGCKDLQVEFFGSPRWQGRFQHACERVISDHGESLLHVAVGTMPKAMFVFLPLVAFLHMLMYWRPRHRYAEHVLFFIHVHAFFFSVMTVLILGSQVGDSWPAAQPAFDVAGSILNWTLALYTLIAMKRVFGRRWTGTLFKACALFIVYMVVLGITVAGVFVYAMLQL